jgi:hypothetical protein
MQNSLRIASPPLDPSTTVFTPSELVMEIVHPQACVTP